MTEPRIAQKKDKHGFTILKEVTLPPPLNGSSYDYIECMQIIDGTPKEDRGIVQEAMVADKELIPSITTRHGLQEKKLRSYKEGKLYGWNCQGRPLIVTVPKVKENAMTHMTENPGQAIDIDFTKKMILTQKENLDKQGFSVIQLHHHVQTQQGITIP